jgi:hypothetical protein
VLCGVRGGVEQHDDAVLVPLVEDLGGHQHALAGAAAFRLVDGDLHGVLLVRWG